MNVSVGKFRELLQELCGAMRNLVQSGKSVTSRCVKLDSRFNAAEIFFRLSGAIPIPKQYLFNV